MVKKRTRGRNWLISWRSPDAVDGFFCSLTRAWPLQAQGKNQGKFIVYSFNNNRRSRSHPTLFRVQFLLYHQTYSPFFVPPHYLCFFLTIWREPWILLSPTLPWEAPVGVVPLSPEWAPARQETPEQRFHCPVISVKKEEAVLKSKLNFFFLL